MAVDQESGEEKSKKAERLKVTMHGSGGKKAQEKIFLISQGEKSEGNKKGSDNGIEHVGGVEDFSRRKSGDGGEK